MIHRIFLLSVIILIFWLTGCSERENGETIPQPPDSLNTTIRFGVATDAQYCDCEPRNNRFYRQGLPRLQAWVEQVNHLQPDFTVHLGDLIDRDLSSYQPMMETLQKLNVQYYLTLGNHEFSVADSLKQKVTGMMCLQNRYCGFEEDRWQFFFLDGTEISLFAWPKDHPTHKVAEAMLDSLESEGAVNALEWNGAIGSKQIAWLGDKLTDACANQQKVILFCHYPIYPPHPLNLWNFEEMLALIGEYPCVKGWFAGHNHEGGYAQKDGVHHVTFSGMVDSEDQTAWATVEVDNNSIRIRGQGRQKSYELGI